MRPKASHDLFVTRHLPRCRYAFSFWPPSDSSGYSLQKASKSKDEQEKVKEKEKRGEARFSAFFGVFRRWVINPVLRGGLVLVE